MPEQFRFERNDPCVIAGLSPADIGRVTAWQNQLADFRFEFHTMHEAGWPCYLRERLGRNLPKVNLKEGSWTGLMLQPNSVIIPDNGVEFLRVITANLAAFRTLARRFYEGVEVVRVVAPSWFVRFTCNRDPRQVHVRLPERGQVIGATFWANMQRQAHKPRCPLHRDSACLDAGVAVQLQPQEAIQQKLRYDDNFQIG